MVLHIIKTDIIQKVLTSNQICNSQLSRIKFLKFHKCLNTLKLHTTYTDFMYPTVNQSVNGIIDYPSTYLLDIALTKGDYQ